MITKREQQVFECIAAGCTTCEIAKKLNIAETTVIFHRKNLKTKLHAKNSCELIVNGIKKGLILAKPLIYDR